jgi:tetratricopeptide (TPR) repeat protein
MIYWRNLFLVVAFLLTTKAVRAENIDAKMRAARTACLSGDSVKGVALLAELFVTTEDSGFIYNQGRCFEQNRRYDDAIARFQEFLRVNKKLKKDEKIDAQKHIADCQELLVKQNGLQLGAESGGGGQTSAAVSRGGTKESKERAAKKACLAGDTAAGVAILIDLYLDTNDTTYLFNQGRCLEQNRRYEDAIGRFREYLVKAKNLTPEEKADTDKHINDCESYLHGSKPTASPTSPETSKSGAAPPPVAQNAPFQAAVSSPATGARSAGSGLRTAGLLVAGMGGAGLIGGLVLNLKVNSMSSELEGNYGLAADATRKNYKTAGWIAYGAGAACLAGGAILYYLGWRRERGSSSVTLLPTAGPDLAGAVLVGAF